MTTLDDKLLGEKRQYYCSSSSEENSDDDSENARARPISEQPESTNNAEWNGASRNTGPKGVIEDWQRFKQLRREQLEETDKERVELFKKLSLTCAPDGELENDEKFLLEYRKQRMQEMMLQYDNRAERFGTVVDIQSPDDFLKTIDEEDKNTTIIVHVHDNSNSACKKINEVLIILAEQYKNIKFCKVLTTTAGLSLHFKISGIPALLVYRDKHIIGNFIRLTDELGDEFCESDVENFLIENNILSNKVPFLTANSKDPQ